MTNTIFLLGAGASVEANLPKASELFEEITNDVSNSSWKALLQELKDKSKNKFEDSISALEFLSSQNFATLELDLLKIISDVKFEIPKSQLEDIYNLVDYIKRIWINDKFQVNNSQSVEYLHPLLQFCKEHRQSIFTLNYDNTIEKAADFLNIEYSTGFANPNELKTEFFDINNFKLGNHDLNLYKLHGSIGWFISKLSSDNLYNNVYKPYNKNDSDEKSSKPAIILGSKNKLTWEGMYLDLLMTFRKQLRTAENIYILGYSFSDNHINKYIQEAWSNYPNKTFTIVDPYPPDFRTLPTPCFLGGVHEVKGSFDFRNLFFSVENPHNNKLHLIKARTSVFCKQLEARKLKVIDLSGL